jgi:hypothetical protein
MMEEMNPEPRLNLLLLEAPGLLFSGDVAPVAGVYKGFHRCGRGRFYFVTPSGEVLPTCKDCGQIPFALWAIAPCESQLTCLPQQQNPKDSAGVRRF